MENTFQIYVYINIFIAPNIDSFYQIFFPSPSSNKDSHILHLKSPHWTSDMLVPGAFTCRPKSSQLQNERRGFFRDWAKEMCEYNNILMHAYSVIKKGKNYFCTVRERLRKEAITTHPPTYCMRLQAFLCWMEVN